MITLQSGETDKIIVTGTTSTPPTPPTPPDPVPDPEEIVGKLFITLYDLNSIILENRTILIKRNMLGTSIEVFTDIEEISAYDVAIDSFNVTPTTVQVTQTDYNILSIQIPTEVLEEDIEVNITLDYTLDRLYTKPNI